MMQNAALLWHVSLLVSPERKALALGLVGLVRVVPVVAFSMFSGVVADVGNRRRLMLLTQTGAAIISLGSVAHLRGLSVVWPLYVLRPWARRSARSIFPRGRRWCRPSFHGSTCRSRSA